MSPGKRLKRRLISYSLIPLLREAVRARGRRDAVFIWVPKAAGTSVYNCLDAPKLKSLNYVKYRFPGRGIVTFGHMDYLALVRKGYVSARFDRNSYKFAFVRNPYDRAVSLFSYLKSRGKIPEDQSFLDFLRRLIDEGFEPIGLYNVQGLSQCNPQVRWIENIDMGFVGKVESLEQDFSVVCRALRMEHVDLPRLNESSRDTYENYMCVESRQIIEHLYREDFEAFGYERLEESGVQSV
ncbi:MAG: sulfotransferase family protein [Marinobacter sp.]|uniref:sulfotransferase family 2 domain-containing protein n=1 Tax=Marinobacter sp. TaxID=50741 RepID=UPI0029C3E2BC|nr:sulfotransferase family 2 domain-containing protein [Marinobacter sp.]MDX5385517.1 sulfotransferase family protein [Marinobacter sp.]